MLYPEASLTSKALKRLYTGTGCVVKGPGGKRQFNLSLVNKHFVMTDQWTQAVQLIICEAEKEFGGSVSGFAMGKEEGIHESCLDHMGKSSSVE